MRSDWRRCGDWRLSGCGGKGRRGRVYSQLPRSAESVSMSRKEEELSSKPPQPLLSMGVPELLLAFTIGE